ncbi:hypothetical protein BTM25_14440 [Actinomadura rubteroloni]|uniref:Uncharacterized protein n=1 Tax=Actinomadura rubteroloni TaxID=1926885 RepID=A0A2P4UPQ9_9ACTN|nr:hypothetical protein [Actinomadura rubteroloni]POM27036.1 hypothetical protein BTM25_14440 [Actinomadura rubteroloni]
MAIQRRTAISLLLIDSETNIAAANGYHVRDPGHAIILLQAS